APAFQHPRGTELQKNGVKGLSMPDELLAVGVGDGDHETIDVGHGFLLGRKGSRYGHLLVKRRTSACGIDMTKERVGFASQTGKQGRLPWRHVQAASEPAQRAR